MPKRKGKKAVVSKPVNKKVIKKLVAPKKHNSAKKTVKATPTKANKIVKQTRLKTKVTTLSKKVIPLKKTAKTPKNTTKEKITATKTPPIKKPGVVKISARQLTKDIMKMSVNNAKIKSTVPKTASTSASSQPVKKASQTSRISRPVTEAPIIIPYQEKHDENYMNEAQREHFRHILLNWKDQLLEEMERTVHHMQDDAANFADPNDRATQEEEFSLELRARDRERKLIKKIEEAMERIANDEYGYCEACGVEIGVKRLEARPTATLCIDCKTIDEIREKHFS